MPYVVKGIPFKQAVGHARMVDHFIGVHEFHGFKAGDARQYGLSAARIPRVKMGFDEAGEDFQVRIEITGVDLDGGTVDFVDFPVGFGLSAIMVFNGVAVHDVPAHQVFQLFSQVGTVHARCDQNGNVLWLQPCRFQCPKQGRQNDFIGHGTREIGDDDAGAFSARLATASREGLLMGVERADDMALSWGPQSLGAVSWQGVEQMKAIQDRQFLRHTTVFEFAYPLAFPFSQ
jgi:hypothetical protein